MSSPEVTTRDEYINDMTSSVKTPDGRTIALDDVIDVYRRFAKIPVPVGARLSSVYGSDGQPRQRVLSLRTDWKVRDMDRIDGTTHVVHHTIKLSKDGSRVKHIQSVGQPVDVTDELAVTARAPVTDYMAVVRKGAKDPESGKTKQWLEIWDKTTKIKSMDTESLNEHSSLVLDSQFGRLLWSPSGQQLLYVSDYKPPKAKSYFKPQKDQKKSVNNGSMSAPEPDTRGQEFVHRDDWGEGLDGISHTVIGVLDVANDFKIRTVELKGWSLGQPFWTGVGLNIGFVGWREEPRRLGLHACPNRLSALFTMDLGSHDSTPEPVFGSDQQSSVRSPRPLPDGSGFVYLDNPCDGSHESVSRLIRYTYESKVVDVLVDRIGRREVVTTESGPKYGELCVLFMDNLEDNCFTSDAKYLIINCFTELQLRIYLLDMNTKHLTPVEFPLPSVLLLDVKDNVLIGSGSAMNVKPNIFVGKLVDTIGSKAPTIKWLEIEANSRDLQNDMSVESYWIPCAEDSGKLLTAILVSPVSLVTKPAATIVLPHCGPHWLHFNTYQLYYSRFAAMFCALGFKTLLINYRGSIGVDEEYVNALIGHAGDRDVRDVIQCVDYFVGKNLMDKTRLCLYGASHGGFLVTHLSGQYSDRNWKACVADNPVTDLSTQPDVSDIPDWAYVESFGVDGDHIFAADKAMKPTAAAVMLEKSPIHWASRVKVPTMLCLGKLDRRVPSSQGLKYYRLLKARGVATRCHMYADSHSLARVESDSDLFVNIALWLLKHWDN